MVRYRLSKAKLNGFHYNVAKTILFWLICVYAVTMTGFAGTFVTFSASSSFVLAPFFLKPLKDFHLTLVKCSPQYGIRIHVQLCRVKVNVTTESQHWSTGGWGEVGWGVQ